MQALHDVVRAGKARYLGASTMYAWQFAEMNAVARQNGWTPFVNMQCQLNLLYREEEREMMPYCAHAEGIAVTTFSPLARGYLAGGGANGAHRARPLPRVVRRRDRPRDRPPRAPRWPSGAASRRRRIAMAWVAGQSRASPRR